MTLTSNIPDLEEQDKVYACYSELYERLTEKHLPLEN